VKAPVNMPNNGHHPNYKGKWVKHYL
jgi:hypothetical protein